MSIEKNVTIIEVKAELKSFTNDKGENIEYVNLRAEVEGVPVFLQCKDITGKAIIRNFVKNGG